MTDFWTRRLAPAQPAPAQTVASTPWWASTPGTNPGPPVSTQLRAFNPQLVPASQQNGEQHFGDLIQQEAYSSTKAMSARDTEQCPDCGSGNFIQPQGHPNALKQCFDCGWNARFIHSTHGISATSKDVPQYNARAQLLSVNNFNPQEIVAHVTV